jgi:hypothetical protein
MLGEAITMDSVTLLENDSGCYTRSRHTLLDRGKIPGGSTTSSNRQRSSAFWLLSGSRYGATPHNAAHNVFMTLPAYTRTSEDWKHHLGSGSRP